MEYGDAGELMNPTSGQLVQGLTEEQAKLLKTRLWQLLAVRTERYNMGDSSSVRVEVAGELMESILYILAVYQESVGSDVAHIDPDADLEAMFALGLAELNRQMDIGKSTAANLPSDLLPIPNQYYQNISADISGFFRKYDVYYFAHQTPGHIGYPLSQPVESLRGIHYVNEYLRCFRIENSFCRGFATDAIIPLLRAQFPSLEYQIGNFFEPIFAAAIALLLIGKNPFSLNISESDRILLHEMIVAWNDKECSERFAAGALHLGRLLGLKEKDDKAYWTKAARLLSKKLHHYLEHLDVLLPSPVSEEQLQENSEPTFIDGEKMDDEKLRKLIEELGGLTVKERIELVKSKVHSIRDLMEVLGTSFWNRECSEYYVTLSDMEMAILLRAYYAKRELRPDWSSPSGWEKVLQNYLESLPSKRKNSIQEYVASIMYRPNN